MLYNVLFTAKLGFSKIQKILHSQKMCQISPELLFSIDGTDKMSIVWFSAFIGLIYLQLLEIHKNIQNYFEKKNTLNA